jgi:hypothetical protein
MPCSHGIIENAHIIGTEVAGWRKKKTVGHLMLGHTIPLHGISASGPGANPRRIVFSVMHTGFMNCLR